MNFLTRTIVKYIGYPLATMLVEKLITAIKDIFIDKEIDNTQTIVTSRQQQKKALMNSIKKAGTNEERQQLSIILATLNNLNSK
jgi:hypothetical protein